MSYNKERYEFIERMFASLEGAGVDRIVGKYVPLQKKGRHLMGLCPFHKDTQLGSFIVTPEKGMWKCFTCGDKYGGNGVKFVSMYRNISYLEAAFQAALDTGIITVSDYDKYSRRKYDEAYVKSLEKRYSEKKINEPKPEKARPEVIHNTYLLMKQMCPLSEEHRKNLKEVRHLTDDRISRDYFTCPVNWKQVDNIISAVKQKYPQITDEELKKVPGFFWDRKKGKVRFSGHKGLCILIRDANGVIKGIQIRRDTVQKGDPRYVWISSTFAFYKPEEYSGGCSCGSPKDVLWPKAGDRNKATVCITEGKFKSEILAQNGNIAVSMQGVTSWRGITDTIKTIEDRRKVSGIYVFLDSDILGKHMLFRQSGEMCRAISEKFPDKKICYAFWKKEVGKGIDDYIINSGSHEGIKYHEWKKAYSIGEKAFQSMLDKYKIQKLQDLRQEYVEKFENELQGMLEGYFCK